jgi:hypothetical protein
VDRNATTSCRAEERIYVVAKKDERRNWKTGAMGLPCWFLGNGIHPQMDIRESVERKDYQSAGTDA